MVTLNATPGSPIANSFATVEEADAYMSGQLFSDTDWEVAELETKIRALITATRLICDAVKDWFGSPTSYLQALPFPRYGLLTRDGSYIIAANVIPDDIKSGTIEYSRQLIVAKRMPDTMPKTRGIRSVSVGPIDVAFEPNVNLRPDTSLPASVWAKIGYLTMGSGSNVRRVVRS